MYEWIRETVNNKFKTMVLGTKNIAATFIKKS